ELRCLSVGSRGVGSDWEACRVVVTWCSADAVDGRAVLGCGELHDLGVTTQFRILGLQIRPMQSVLAGADLDGVDSGFTRHRDLVYPAFEVHGGVGSVAKFQHIRTVDGHRTPAGCMCTQRGLTVLFSIHPERRSISLPE